MHLIIITYFKDRNGPKATPEAYKDSSTAYSAAATIMHSAVGMPFGRRSAGR